MTTKNTQQRAAVFIHGPQGCGKTRNADFA